jgi:hypothetical protein
MKLTTDDEQWIRAVRIVMPPDVTPVLPTPLKWNALESLERAWQTEHNARLTVQTKEETAQMAERITEPGVYIDYRDGAAPTLMSPADIVRMLGRAVTELAVMRRKRELARVSYQVAWTVVGLLGVILAGITILK